MVGSPRNKLRFATFLHGTPVKEYYQVEKHVNHLRCVLLSSEFRCTCGWWRNSSGKGNNNENEGRQPKADCRPSSALHAERRRERKTTSKHGRQGTNLAPQKEQTGTMLLGPAEGGNSRSVGASTATRQKHTSHLRASHLHPTLRVRETCARAWN